MVAHGHRVEAEALQDGELRHVVERVEEEVAVERVPRVQEERVRLRRLQPADERRRSLEAADRALEARVPRSERVDVGVGVVDVDDRDGGLPQGERGQREGQQDGQQRGGVLGERFHLHSSLPVTSAGHSCIGRAVRGSSGLARMAGRGRRSPARTCAAAGQAPPSRWAAGARARVPDVRRLASHGRARPVTCGRRVEKAWGGTAVALEGSGDGDARPLVGRPGAGGSPW